MNLYLITSDKDLKLTQAQEQLLAAAGNVRIVSHVGKLSDIQALVEDTEEKVIGIDPDSVDWNVDVGEFDLIKNVKAVCTQSTSFGWLHPDELKEKGIAVHHVPGFSTDSVAEYAIALAIESARQLPLQLKDMRLDRQPKPMLLKGKTMAIVGLGHIGKRIAEIAQGIGMHVVYWSRTTRDEHFTNAELNELFSRADVLIPALKDCDETKTLITHELLDRLKPTAIVVGINRIKDLFDEPYLISLVEQGRVGGVCV